jgi:hypothetical protein
MSHKDEKKHEKKAKSKDKSKAKSKKKKHEKRERLKYESHSKAKPHSRPSSAPPPLAEGEYDVEATTAKVQLILRRMHKSGEATGRVVVELEYSQDDPRGAHRVLLGAVERKGYLEWTTDLPEFPNEITFSSPHDAIEALLQSKISKLAGSLVGTVAGLGLEVVP